MNPFFTIVIPVYNVAPFLRECLDSVCTQTFTDWEAICIDDGSTDGSGEILDEYAGKNKLFRVIHQQNSGVGAARNKAIDKARGDWICFLDADDVWHVNLLAIIEQGIKKNKDAKLLRFSYKEIDEVGYLDYDISKYINCFRIIDISKKISMNDFFNFYLFCYVYRRDIIGIRRFPRYIRGEDRCFLNDIQLNVVNSIYATDIPLYGYRKRQGSAMNSIPSYQVLCDEMDHRLDIMEMIDASGKKVVYAGDVWLEKYFTTHFYHIISSRDKDKYKVVDAWRSRLPRLHRMKGLSKYGCFVSWSCSYIHLRVWDALVCYIIPRLHMIVRQCAGSKGN